MEKLEAEAHINHFSHSHPLKQVSFQPSATTNNNNNNNNNNNRVIIRITCSACTKQASGLIYMCSPCNYCLHINCSKIPQRYKHEADRNHSLTLLSVPAYPEGKYRCNACGTQDTGFCYHCEKCQLDLHVVCAFLGSSIKSKAHDHDLNLCFVPPYENKAFICDICRGSGSNHWLYRCHVCEFDAHLKCAKDSEVKLQPIKTSCCSCISSNINGVAF